MEEIKKLSQEAEASQLSMLRTGMTTEKEFILTFSEDYGKTLKEVFEEIDREDYAKMVSELNSIADDEQPENLLLR